MTSSTHDALIFLLLAYSPVVGSFLNVLIDRLPRGQSIVSPRSSCRSCGHFLGAFDLIPILSYVFARGRCRHCSATIPPFHLYVEIAAVFAAVFAVMASPPMATAADIALAALFLWLLLALAGTDLLWFRLPDALTGMLLICGLAMSLVHGVVTPLQALVGAALGSGILAGLRFGYQRLRGREGLGLGDVKLMAGIGAALGPWNLPLTFLVASLIGLTGALIYAQRTGNPTTAQTRVPFGAALCAAAALVWLFPVWSL